MRTTIEASEVLTPRGRALLQLASVVAAFDGIEEAILFSEPIPGGHLLDVEFFPGQVLLEHQALRDVCEAVADAKGDCLFDFAVIEPPSADFAEEVEPTNRIADSVRPSPFRNEDEDDGANWWGRGNK